MKRIALINLLFFLVLIAHGSIVPQETAQWREVSIPIKTISKTGNTVTLQFDSSIGSAYTIACSEKINGIWGTGGIQANFNENEPHARRTERFDYVAQSASTEVKLTYVNGAPDSAFFVAFKIVHN